MNDVPGGFGVGLRTKHYPEFLEAGLGGVEWAEIITENVLGRGGRPAAVLERVRRDVPIFLHGVSLSIGGLDPLREDYLSELAELRRNIDAAGVTDHLCFGTFGGHFGHDLWPLPYTEEALAHVVARVSAVQERLGVRIALENVSSYVRWEASEMTEWEFLVEVARRADCRLLLDINNVYVSAHNHGFDARTYIDAVPPELVAQHHLAGHLDEGTHLLDNHGAPVAAGVWELYGYARKRFGAVPTIIEWDEGVPELDELLAECERARAVAREADATADGGLAWAS